MSQTTLRKESYRAALDRAVKWMLSHQQADGGFGEVETMSHYMLLGTSLLQTGCSEAACRLMPALKRLFVKPDGSFDPPEIKSGRASALLERGYAPSWIIYSSQINLAFDISLPAMPYLLQLMDPQSGGMFGTLADSAQKKGIVNPSVTCVAGEAALTTGYITEARRM